MKLNLAVMAFAIPVLLMATPAAAEDAVSTHAIENVLQRPDFGSQMEGVTFSFGAGSPAVSRRIEEGVTTSVRTRKFGRSTEESCQWVMMSALIQLRQRAIDLGGNAVINIRSNWRNVEWSSESEYQCASGFLMAGVALKGDVVEIR